jgi:hypothetical protein
VKRPVIFDQDSPLPRSGDNNALRRSLALRGSVATLSSPCQTGAQVTENPLASRYPDCSGHLPLTRIPELKLKPGQCSVVRFKGKSLQSRSANAIS